MTFWVVAKEDVRILREDYTFTNFIAGKWYRAMYRYSSVILIDEDRKGFMCDMDTFFEHFGFTD